MDSIVIQTVLYLFQVVVTGWRLVVGWWIEQGECLVEEWLSVAQLSKVCGIPETTVRRYLRNLEEFFRSEQVGRGKKYHPGTVEILQRIAMLYNADRETLEVKRILADEYAFVVDDENSKDATAEPPAYDITGKLDEFRKNQEDFNKQLLHQLHEQQKYINELIKNQKTDMEQQKQLVSPAERRAERFDQIMADRKVKRRLEKEALELWAEKSSDERMIKVGWFRYVENQDNRDAFVKNHIDEHFEACLKEEFNI